MADINYYSIADNDHPIILNTFNGPQNPLDYDDILKLSHATDVSVSGITIPGGKEDCVDMNRDTTLITIANVTVIPNGEYGFTIKGGSKHISLRDVIFQKHGKTYDIDLGNWSDQNKKDKTTGITLTNVTAADGQPVRVRVLFADRPTVIGGNVKVTVYPAWIVAIYRFFRGML